MFVNLAYTTRIDRLSQADSDGMLDSLFGQVAVPEVQCRVRWEPTVIIWDNRSVQHYACGDYLPARRVMERVSLAGTVVESAGRGSAPADATSPSKKTRSDVDTRPANRTEL